MLVWRAGVRIRGRIDLERGGEALLITLSGLREHACWMGGEVYRVGMREEIGCLVQNTRKRGVERIGVRSKLSGRSVPIEGLRGAAEVGRGRRQARGD
jgi:hypothetical protein